MQVQVQARHHFVLLPKYMRQGRRGSQVYYCKGRRNSLRLSHTSAGAQDFINHHSDLVSNSSVQWVSRHSLGQVEFIGPKVRTNVLLATSRHCQRVVDDNNAWPNLVDSRPLGVYDTLNELWVDGSVTSHDSTSTLLI